MFRIFFHYLLDGFIFSIRAITVTCAVLLIVRSITLRFMPVKTQYIMRPLRGITDILILPVRSILPGRICSRQLDYSYLISAIILLLLGLGLNGFLESVGRFLVIDQ